MAKSCPHCHKVVKDLNSHIKRMHKGDDTHKNESNEEPERELETLELPEVEDTPAEGQLYRCIDCGQEFRGKQDKCPKCGVALDWEGIHGQD